MDKTETMNWIDAKWKPKLEGPYLLKFKMPHPKKKGEWVIRYFIKRWNVSNKPFKYKGRFTVDTRGHYGYFTRGDLPTKSALILLAWMPIQDHDYMALEKNQTLKKKLREYYH